MVTFIPVILQISLPRSTLDEIIDKLGGPDNVAEMTGRRARIVRRSPDETPQYEVRDANDNTGFLESLNVKEVWRPGGFVGHN